MAGTSAGRSTGPRRLRRGSKAAQNKKNSVRIFFGVLRKCSFLPVGFDSCCLGSTSWHPSARLRSPLSSQFQLSLPRQEQDLSTSPFPSRGRHCWVLGAGRGMARWDVPRLCASRGCLPEGTSHLPGFAVPVLVQAAGQQRTVTLQYYKGAYHPGCPLLGLSPEEANINQCKHVRLNGLFIFPTTAVLMHRCLLTITLQGGWQHAFGLTAAHEAKLESCAVDQGRRRMGTNAQESSFSNYWLQETFLLCLSFPCKKKKLDQSNEFPGGGVHTWARICTATLNIPLTNLDGEMQL